jgi:hypothetical protein
MTTSRPKLAALFAFILLAAAALAAGVPAQAGPVTWPKDGMFHNPLIVMTTEAGSAKDMSDYTDVNLYVLLPGSKGIPLQDPNIHSTTINPAATCLKAEMHVRGQSTGSNPKHQYAVKLTGTQCDGKPDTGHFLDMKHGGKHWVFNAPGKEVVDPTMIRNVMAFDMQRTLGENTGSKAWAPRTKYFEFFVVYNQDSSTTPSYSDALAGYKGVYINFEHIRAEDHRLSTLPDPYAPKTGTTVGGVIMQVNPPYLPGTTPIPPAKRQELLASNLAGNSSPVLLEWPELDFFNGGGGSQAQLTNIQNWFYNPDQGGDFLGWAYLFTNNCTTGPPSGANSGKGFLPQTSAPAACLDNGSYWDQVEKYTDLQSFAEYLLLNEVAKDPDGYHKSTYMYRNPDTLDAENNPVPGRIFGGPLWDKNKSYYLGTYGGTFDSTEGWSFTTANCGQAAYWWYVLSQYGSFQDFINTIWQSAYTTDGAGAFDYNRIEKYVNKQMDALLGPAPAAGEAPNGPFTRDQELWFATDPAAAQTQLQTDVTTLLSNIKARLQWMNNNVADLTSAVATDCHQ